MKDGQKDIERFSKGFCVPRDLVVNGELVQTILGDTEISQIRRSSVVIKSAEEILNDLRDALQREGKISCEDTVALRGGIETSSIAGIPKSAFSGISGFSEELFARTVERTRASADTLRSLGYSVPDEGYCEYRSKICGKIRDYLFVDKNKSGHLAVELIHEEFLSRQRFLDCDPDHVTAYHWDIEIAEGGYSVHKRDDDALLDSSTPPFPTLPKVMDEEGKPIVAFPPHALDPDDPRSIWCRGLDYKLFARGESVKITDVYRKVDDYPLMRIDDASEEGMKFYVSTDETCIDIMFKGYPPETQLPPQVEYCLGRCENPPIINSGGR